ncbi:MAG: hypothetical protein QG594_241 [Bacteroidota bacterium]|nr:hypothetical protein [Bacteroidota bacterium]
MGIPPPLDFEFPYPLYKLEEYYKELKKCILLSEDFFSFYRIDLTFQETMYKDLSLRIFTIRRIKFLNKTEVKESIENSMPLDGNPKRTLLTMIPKMLKKSGFLKKKREKLSRRYNKVKTEPFIKFNDTLTINKMPRRNSVEIDIDKEFDIETLEQNINAMQMNQLFPADVVLIIFK